MLTRTFQHMQGIGEATEQLIWERGIHTWEDFRPPLNNRLAARTRAMVDRALIDSFRAIARRDVLFFARALPHSLRWRMFPEFMDNAAYLDIETTGLDREHDTITTIALYDGSEIKWYVQGDNLENFPRDIQQYNLLVSYNGSRFDLPFIERFFNIRLDQAQIDLCFVLRALGYRGGLKRCERTLGIERPGMMDVDGYTAVLLWHDYRRTNNPKALETLLAYNICDAANLASLMAIAYNHAISQTPFAEQILPMPNLPPLPFAVDRETVEQLQQPRPTSYYMESV
jgi:uncharacterized protein YprB with RNaseH-like and TPR domain